MLQQRCVGASATTLPKVTGFRSNSRATTCRALATAGRDSLAFRSGTWKDAPTIFSSVLQEKMNPLVGLEPASFTVAEKRGQVVGFGRTKPLQPGAVELASLTVLPEHRGEGIGSALIDALASSVPGQDIYLVTIGRRVALYERQGFQEVSRNEIPGALLFEYYAGTVVAKLAVSDRLVVMKRVASGNS